MELFYCSRCQHAIPPGGADEGKYFKLGDELICPKCYYKVKPGDHSGQTIPVEPVGDDRLLGANRIAPATPARPHKPPSATMAPVKPPTSRIMPAARRPVSPSSGRIGAARGSGAVKRLALALGAAAVLALVFTAWFLRNRRQEAPGTEAAVPGSTATKVANPPVRTPVLTPAQPPSKTRPDAVEQPPATTPRPEPKPVPEPPPPPEPQPAAEPVPVVDQLENGLVAHWKLDEGRGDAASDATERRHDGRLIDGPAWATGKIGGALRFDGADDRVDMGDPVRLRIVGAITMAAWVCAEAMDGYRNILAKGYAPGATGEVFLRINNGQYEGGSWDGKAHAVSVAMPAGDVGHWVHLTATYDGKAWSLYRNGALAGSMTDAAGAVRVDAGWALGSRGGTGERYFQGSLDDVRIYNRALSAGEVAKLVGGGSVAAP